MIGLDIGGANIKAADTGGRAVVRPFPLWKNPAGLPGELKACLSSFADHEPLAVTMTAELADCFATKAEGVAFVLDCVEEVAVGRTVHVWQTGGTFVTPAEARNLPLNVAAANWHALATWCARWSPSGTALLIDVGSTTTDLIPIRDGRPIPRGLTDLDRLQSGELVYTGVRRTPVCAVASRIAFRGTDVPLAAEFFATMQDVYLLLGEIAENREDRDTADGRPATIEAAKSRLARMLCADRSELTDEELCGMARALAAKQRELIEASLRRVLDRLETPCRQVIVSGSGEFLAIRVVQALLPRADLVRLSEKLGSSASEAACAAAVAHLGCECVRG